MSIPDLKPRVIASLNKLSDRDTAALAAAELNSIAKTLTPATFSPFLSLLSSTTSSHKSPVRTQTVRLLSLLSSAHANSLSPHLPKLLAALLRRLKDSDSSVRNACVDAVSSISSNITSPPFSAISNPLINALLHDQDYNVQIGAAMCLAAAIEAAPAVESAEMRKLLPRLVKLVRSDCFKAKAAMLLLMGSVVGGGGAASGGVKYLTECLVEFLSGEDWAARKAAAEALWRLGVSERNGVVLGEVKGFCLVALEKCRFDKVKVVRETMNKAFELWKEIATDGVSGPTTLSPKDCGSEIDSTPSSKVPREIGFKTPKPKKTIPTSRSPPYDCSSTTTSQMSIPLKASSRKQRMDSVEASNWKTEIGVPQAYLKVTNEDDSRITHHSASASNESFSESKQEIKHVLFNKNCDEKTKRVSDLRSRSRVVPLIENDKCEIDFAVDYASEDIDWNHEEVEDLSRIQKQLVHIENQQSSLLDLLQRFIGSSLNGMNSLQTRVNGLEMALDEMSQNLAVSCGNVTEADAAGNTCCMLPHSEFLRSKFWRTEGLYSTSRVSFTGRNHTLDGMNSARVKEANTKIIKLEYPKNWQVNGDRC